MMTPMSSGLIQGFVRVGEVRFDHGDLRPRIVPAPPRTTARSVVLIMNPAVVRAGIDQHQIVSTAESTGDPRTDTDESTGAGADGERAGAVGVDHGSP